MSELDPLLAVLLAIAFHSSLWLASLRWGSLVLLAATLMFASFLSRAPDLPMVSAFKVTRVYLAALLTSVSLLHRRRCWRFGAITWAMLLPLLVYGTGALWSDRPVDAGLNKAMFLVTWLAGVVTARYAAAESLFQRHMRVLLVSATAAIAAVYLYLAAVPTLTFSRLSPFDMNPNFVGLFMRIAILLCIAVALGDPARTWRWTAMTVGGAAMALLLYSGSRAAFGATLVGGTLLLLPLARHPRQLLAAAVTVGLALILTGSMVEDVRLLERLGSLQASSRVELWIEMLQQFREHPWFGVGWMAIERGSGRLATINRHSIYVQLLCEVGSVGTFLFLAGAGFVVVHGWRLRAASGDPATAFGLAMLCSILIHGLAESAALLATVDSLMLGFSVGLLDRAAT